MTGRTVAVVARGNPLDRGTWSGTPRAICEALESRGISVVPIDASADSLLQRAASAHGILRYGTRSRVAFSYLSPRREIGRRALRGSARIPRIHTDTMWLDDSDVDSRDCVFRDTDIVEVLEAWNVDQRLIDRLAEEHSRIYRRMGLVLATSQWCAEKIMSRYGVPSDKIAVVGTGLGGGISSREHSASYANKKTLCVARVRHHQKGIDLLLEGFAIAHRECPDLSLDLVVPEGSVLEQPGVRIHSDLDSSELSRMFSEAALYAMPARWEPWGLVYLEALSHATPVLTSANCAGPELCGNGMYGFIVEDLSAASIATSIIDAHGDPAALSSKGQAGQQFSGTMKWEAAARAIEDWVSSLS